VTEREHDAEEQVEDLDVPESEGEDVKGGSYVEIKVNVADKASPQLGDGSVTKWTPGGAGFTVK
jgi:hypothetical protein